MGIVYVAILCPPLSCTVKTEINASSPPFLLSDLCESIVRGLPSQRKSE